MDTSFKFKKRESEIEYFMKELKQILKVEQKVVRVDREVESARHDLQWTLQCGQLEHS